MAASAALPENVYIGRQAIVDGNGKTYGYELLYRDGTCDYANISDFTQASLDTITNGFLEIGIDAISGGLPVFLNVTRDVLLGNYLEALPQEGLVLEILETEEPDDVLLRRLRELRASGYRIALDDFVPGVGRDALLKVADIVKLDVLGVDRSLVRKWLDQIRPFDVVALAEKVETNDVFRYCRDSGFELFQGFFFARPHVESGKRMRANRISALSLLAKVQDTEARLDVVESAIRADASVAYKLLRYINSAGMCRTEKVESIRQAIVLAGLSRIRCWASLLALAGVDDKPHELLLNSLTRARMCEMLAGELQADNTDMHFSVGLFSLLDAMMDRPFAELLSELPLAEPVKSALLNGEGQAGEVLRCVVDYEQRWVRDSATLGLGLAVLRSAYLSSVAWAGLVVSEIGL